MMRGNRRYDVKFESTCRHPRPAPGPMRSVFWSPHTPLVSRSPRSLSAALSDLWKCFFCCPPPSRFSGGPRNSVTSRFFLDQRPFPPRYSLVGHSPRFPSVRGVLRPCTFCLWKYSVSSLVATFFCPRLYLLCSQAFLLEAPPGD